MSKPVCVQLPCGNSDFFSTEDNMIAYAAMRGVCANYPDVLIHKNISCSFCETAKTPEERFSIAIADPWCEGNASKITIPEKVVFLKDTFDLFDIKVLDIVKGMLQSNAYITVSGMVNIPDVGKTEKKCLITGFDDEAETLTVWYRTEGLKLDTVLLKYSECEEFFFQTKENEILFLNWIPNPKALYELPSCSKLIKELSDYSQSQNMRFQNTTGYIYGLRAMERLRKELIFIFSQKEDVPLAYISQYSHHKHFLVSVIRRLCECEYLPPVFLENSEDIEDLADSFDAASEGYIATHSEDSANMIVYCMMELEQIEKKLIPKIWPYLYAKDLSING